MTDYEINNGALRREVLAGIAGAGLLTIGTAERAMVATGASFDRGTRAPRSASTPTLQTTAAGP